MKIPIILGTRQGIMKMSPIYLSERSPFIVKAYKYMMKIWIKNWRYISGMM